MINIWGMSREFTTAAGNAFDKRIACLIVYEELVELSMEHRHTPAWFLELADVVYTVAHIVAAQDRSYAVSPTYHVPDMLSSFLQGMTYYVMNGSTIVLESACIAALRQYPILEEILLRTHDANMRKFEGGVIRNAAGKIMKPEGWQPANYDDLFV